MVISATLSSPTADTSSVTSTATKNLVVAEAYSVPSAQSVETYFSKGCLVTPPSVDAANATISLPSRSPVTSSLYF